MCVENSSGIAPCIFSLYFQIRYNNKTYTIDDIDFSENPSNTFEKKDGTKISYAEYMAAVCSRGEWGLFVIFI